MNTNFSDALKRPVLPTSSRITFPPRQGYGKKLSSSGPPKVENLYLSKKCGFCLPFFPEISMEKYLCAIGDIVGDDKMVFAGKNNDIIKFYLINESEVQKFYDLHPQIIIEDKVLTVRKLVDNGHKVFLCNTEPSMPDSLLIDELSKYTKVISSVKFVNLGVRGERFGHLLSFRRCVLVDRVDDLPASFNLVFDNTSYKIFVVIDRAKCFKCHSEGHFVNNCPSNIKTPAQDRLSQKILSEVEKKKNDSNINALLPSFSMSSTTDPIPAPLNQMISTSFPPLLPTSVAAVSDTGSDISVSTQEPSEVKSKKRSSASPIKESIDKKLCVSSTNELLCLSPLIKQYEPSSDPDVIINLIDDLKQNRKKIDLIKTKYELDPVFLITLLHKLVSSDSTAVEPKLKKRLQNLIKSLTDSISSSDSVPDPQNE